MPRLRCVKSVGKQVTVGTTATPLLAADPKNTEPCFVYVAARGSASVFIGGSDCDSTHGLEIKTTDPPVGPIQLGPGETLYGACASATQRCDVYVSRTYF